MKKNLLFATLGVAVVIGGLVSCNNNGLDVSGPGDGSIQFGLSRSSEFSVLTKSTTPAGSITSFKAEATLGTAGSESEVAWNNVAFADDGTSTNTYNASPAKYWPVSDQSYNFYAVGASESSSAVLAAEAPDMAFGAAGTTISMAADYDKDVVCAYFPYADNSYKVKNELSFKHIFARVAGVTVTASGVCEISNISISIVDAKTGGTYNLRTGANQTDGTGWSDKVPASGDKSVYSRSAAIVSGSSDAAGSVYDDSTGSLYLVPGSYYLKATWTAHVDDYTQTYTDMTSIAAVNFVAGKINSISANLTGNATEVVFDLSVTEWSDNAVDVGTFALVHLPRPVGRFTVNADGDQVGFAPGNLQCTIESGPDATGYNYTGTDWCFADHQWDYLGDTDGANSFTVGKKMDLFGWVGQSASYDTYGLCSLFETINAYYGTSDADGLKTDWGDIPGVISACGDGWFTPSNADYVYLFDGRATGNTVNGTPNARYTEANIRTDVSGVNGIILFPDDYSAGTPSGVTWGTINAASAWGTQCTAAGWASLEAAGCVFLPAARQSGGYGYYWSSSPGLGSAGHARYMSFYSGNVRLQLNNGRCNRYSVRLAKRVN